MTEDEAYAAMVRYRKFCEATGKIGTETVMQCATFFGPRTEAWLNDWTPPRQTAQPAQPNRYVGLAKKDYGETRPGILADALDEDDDDGQFEQQDPPEEKTKAKTSGWTGGTYAGILADALDEDEEANDE